MSKQHIESLLGKLQWLDPDRVDFFNGKYQIHNGRKFRPVQPTEEERLIGFVTQCAIARGFTVSLSQNQYGGTLAAIERESAPWGIHTHEKAAIALLESWVTALKTTQEES